MKIVGKSFLAMAAGFFWIAVCSNTEAQVGIFSKQDLLDYTPLYKGERFIDGRPKVSDATLDRMKDVAIEEAWSVLQKYGYNDQFEGNWTTNIPSPNLVGRAVTAVFMPLRPDVNDVIKTRGEKEKRVGAQNSWIIDTLVKRDVLVVDLFGKIVGGTFAGDNLSNSIKTKTGTGIIIDGACRDLRGINEINDFPVFVRGWDPSFLVDVMLMGINSPIRIGRAVVMPGDVVLANAEGAIFIPANLADEVVETAGMIHYRDDFGHQRLQEGKYTPGQIDSKWTEAIERDFDSWLKEKGKQLTPWQIEQLKKSRTW